MANETKDNQTPPDVEGAVCAVPLQHDEKIVIGHGSGGRMMHSLIEKHFLTAFDNPYLRQGDDASVVPMNHSANGAARLAISTDSHVVLPLFFPGGDIGRLAVCGTVNDIAMSGATPFYLTAGFILEEGLAIETLDRILKSMQFAAKEADVLIVAGDTKVVQKGKADGCYITTAGYGLLDDKHTAGGANARPGDVVILSGSIGEHGVAVLEARGELGFQSGVVSDVAPLNHMTRAIINEGCNVHVMRDPTRGGLATSLNEIARQSNVGMLIDEKKITVHTKVGAVCEMLGLDPLYVANEGKFITIVAPESAQLAIDVLRNFPAGAEAQVIGEVTPAPEGRVLMKTVLGTTRVIDMLSGELLPRIC